MSPSKKNLTLNDLGEMLEHVVTSVADLASKEDIKDMATKADVRNIVRKELKPIETRLMAVESKVTGIDRRLDAEAIRRDDEKIPARVANIEKKVFGASKEPARR